jgi:hypothetical protein
LNLLAFLREKVFVTTGSSSQSGPIGGGLPRVNLEVGKLLSSFFQVRIGSALVSVKDYELSPFSEAPSIIKNNRYKSMSCV